MFRYKRGPFRVISQPSKENETTSLHRRNIFMSQMSKSEFEKMYLQEKLGTEELLTILEFDKKRNTSFQSQDTIEEDI